MARKLAELRHGDALAGEQALHPIRVPAAVAAGEEQFAVDLAAILLDTRRDVHDTPHLRLATLSADEHRHQLPRIQPIGLRSAAAPIDFDARGVDDPIRDPAAYQIPMQPEAVPPGLIAAAHRRGRRQAEVRFRSRDLGLEPFERSRWELATQRWLIHRAGHREDPLRVAELEGEI
jgi:hypothetical protein